MITSLVVTIVGTDRPGLVSAVSDKAAEFGANWADSLMANLAGQFAGILLLQVPSRNADMLVAALKELDTANLHVAIARGTAAVAPQKPSRRIKLDLVGQDRPGIIHNISSELAKHGVSIEKLQTRISSGAMSGEQMFHMQATLVVPTIVSEDALRAALEGLANEMMVDVSLDDPREVG
ncbi:MAG: glycine cleavage system protein R [Aeromicrobium sp.]|nr:glycine cleavage system protein R [Burkholderiales bacterium]